MCGIIGLAELKSGPSHELIAQALAAIACMEHRGGSLETTGDGAGILFRPDRGFFERFITPGRRLPEGDRLMVGTIWFLRGERNVRELQREIDAMIRVEGLAPLGWRLVPTWPDALGARAREDMPRVFQLLMGQGHRMGKHLRTTLRRLRERIENEFRGQVAAPSLSPGTTVYKALATSDQLRRFYPDLSDPDLKTRVVIGHRRFATNTFSNWHLVQPFRLLAHNGEINTISANTRAVIDAEDILGGHNVLLRHGSDSAQLDRALDFLMGKRVGPLPETMRRLLSPSAEGSTDPRYARYVEASRRMLGTLGSWEGPAALLATDGDFLVAQLDRMGLRPLRYALTHSGTLVVGSEAGAVALDPAQIASDGQLEPGGMLIGDLDTGELVRPEDSEAWTVARTRLGYTGLSSTDLLPLRAAQPAAELDVQTLKRFGWTRPRAQKVRETVKSGKEPVHSMGNDTPLAVFSENHSRVYSFLHQVVAVVTNPAIDPLREGQAMDTTVHLGCSPSLRDQKRPGTRAQYKLPHPVLSDESTAALVGETHPDLRTVTLDATFDRDGDPRVLTWRLHQLADEAVAAIRGGASILILSDRGAAEADRLPLPAVFVVSAVHRRLTRVGLRRQTSLVVQTGSVHESHDLAVLIAYGATAVNPYAMLQIARETPKTDPAVATERLIGGLVKGLRRIMSKMGITSVSGYRGSGLFEAVGLSPDVVDYYLPGTPARVGGLTMVEVHADIVARAEQAAGKALPPNRNVKVYRKEVTNALQLVARNSNDNGDWDTFVQLLEDTPPVYLRDLLGFAEASPVDISEVAPVSEVVAGTLRGAAMSHGALHSTAHRAIAAAFNELGSMSNSGEGGEDARRNPGGPWQADRNRTRQVASGRFGVDAAYLVGADELEIKIGQGAKPGEGGHLPAAKVTAEIAAIRKTAHGVDLISPPPHHDIYSIEDLAQLIRNLAAANPAARIAVKVPSVTNLGTIAVGVAKAGAEVITVSGFEGGTGAASSGSILHAGLPLELGLTDAHQYLSQAGIRRTVRLRADGGIKSGSDVAKALALGADEVAFGTPLMVAENCVFCRGCNHGNCPVGLATQDDARQDRLFMKRGREDRIGAGTAMDTRYLEAKAGVRRYLECLAQDVRRILASLGLRHPAELTGRVDLLRQIRTGNARWDRLDLSELLFDADSEGQNAPIEVRFPIDRVNAMLVEAAQPVLDGAWSEASIPVDVCTADQATGATLAGVIAQRGGLPPGALIEVRAQGYAGQGFGFAATGGMHLLLEGVANDCVGEVMGEGARVTVVAPDGWAGVGTPQLAGNAVGYGATGGELFLAGRVGQRVGVRNSGAVIVCEGAGKYAFEYMTGGRGVVLGPCAGVVGSGMTGGELYLLDAAAGVLHEDAVAVAAGDEDLRELRSLLVRYAERTRSAAATELVDGWEQARGRFVRVRPRLLVEREVVVPTPPSRTHSPPSPASQAAPTG